MTVANTLDLVHTIGPWELIPNENDNGFKIRATETPEETIVAHVNDAAHMAGGEYYEAKGNGIILSNALNMRDALKAILAEVSRPGFANPLDAIRIAQEALEPMMFIEPLK